MTTLNGQPIKPTISVDIPGKIDGRVGLVERVEDMPKPTDLVRLAAPISS